MRGSTCEKFVKMRNYVTDSLSKEEEDFPLAYSFVAHKDAGQVEVQSAIPLLGILYPKKTSTKDTCRDPFEKPFEKG